MYVNDSSKGNLFLTIPYKQILLLLSNLKNKALFPLILSSRN